MGEPNPPSKPFLDLHEALSAALVNTTKASGQVANEDIGFIRHAQPDLAAAIDNQAQRLLDLATGLTRRAAELTDVTPPTWNSADDLDEHWKQGVEVFDGLLERADTSLDRHTGKIKSEPSKEAPAYKKEPKILDKAFRNQDMAKPQLNFEIPIDNTDTGFFRPIITSKPHALVPLQVEPVTLTDGHIEYDHPYEHELANITYPHFVFEEVTPIPSQPYKGTSAIWIDTPKALASMIEDLKREKEIAIDLEHHDSHSYYGIVSLMQLSTRSQDYIIDTLAPWRRQLEALNTVFCDPSIIKVFQGAFMDIEWLQRDFGVYVVGLFDTYDASTVLGFPKRSLQYLLKKYVDFDANKQYQMADWRIRPLPVEMMDYARSDTHFLLYIYDCLRAELLAKSAATKGHPNFIKDVLDRSKKTSATVHKRDVYEFDTGKGLHGWGSLLSGQVMGFSKEQFYVFRAVHKWRDALARELDESLHSVMPRYMLEQLAVRMPLKPEEVGAVVRQHEILRKRKHELATIVSKAKKDSVIGAPKEDIIKVAKRARRTRATPEPELKPPVVFPALSKRSQLWGTTLDGKSDEEEGGVSLEIPLPPLTAEIFANGSTKSDAKPEAPKMPEHEFKRKEEPEVLILRETQTKKIKTKDKEIRAKEKEAKALAKKEKKEKKLAAAAAAEQPVDAIDYAAAPSVLNAPRDRPKKPDGSKTEKPKKEPFDPYKKSADAVEGLKRPRQEPGKSGTWRS